MEKKLLLGILMITILSGIGGFMVHAKTNGNEKQELADSLMQHCKDNLLPAYEDGFMNSLIKDLDSFALDCVGGDVKMYSWGNLDGSKNGVLFQCDANNKTLPIKYPDKRKLQ